MNDEMTGAPGHIAPGVNVVVGIGVRVGVRDGVMVGKLGAVKVGVLGTMVDVGTLVDAGMLVDLGTWVNVATSVEPGTGAGGVGEFNVSSTVITTGFDRPTAPLALVALASSR